MSLLNFPERDELLSVDEKTTPSSDYITKFHNYLDFFINYCKNELRNTPYRPDQVIPIVFVTQIKNENQFKQYLRMCLYCAQLYMEYLKKNIEARYIKRYRVLRYDLITDIETLMVYYESNNKNKKDIDAKCGSRKNVSVMDMLSALNQIRILENAPQVENIDFRNIKAYQEFIIRQTLEKVGRGIIGYEEIVDSNGNPIHKFTQVAWTFLSEYNASKSKEWEINTPISLTNIYKINQWSNSFVHTAFIHASYIQFYATEMLNLFMQAPTSHVLCYDQKYRLSNMYGDFRIKNYLMLRSDFEKYIQMKHNKAVVRWNDYSKVSAYIISLGEYPQKS